METGARLHNGTPRYWTIRTYRSDSVYAAMQSNNWAVMCTKRLYKLIQTETGALMRKQRPNVTPGQKLDIAQRRVQGQRVKQIAGDMGLSPSTVAHQLVRPEVKSLMTSLRDHYGEQIQRSFGALIARLETGITDQDSQNWLECGDRLLRVIEQGDRAASRLPDVASGPPGGSMVELLQLYQSLMHGGA